MSKELKKIGKVFLMQGADKCECGKDIETRRYTEWPGGILDNTPEWKYSRKYLLFLGVCECGNVFINMWDNRDTVITKLDKFNKIS